MTVRNGLVPVGIIPSSPLSYIIPHLFLLQFSVLRNHLKSSVINSYVKIQYSIIFRGLIRKQSQDNCLWFSSTAPNIEKKNQQTFMSAILMLSMCLGCYNTPNKQMLRYAPAILSTSTYVESWSFTPDVKVTRFTLPFRRIISHQIQPILQTLFLELKELLKQWLKGY